MKKGEIIEVLCDEYGTIIESFWRKRVLDSKNDNCVELLSTEIYLDESSKKNKPIKKEKNKKKGI